MTPVRHAHVSGRYDAPRRAFARYVAAVVTDGRATSLTTTETYGSLKPLRQALNRNGHHWYVTRRGEYVVAVRADTYRRPRRHLAAGLLERMSFVYAGREEWRDLKIHRRRFVHRATGKRVLFVAAHAPSAIEAGDNYRTNSQSRASALGLSKLGKRLARARRRQPGLVVVLGIDTNADHKRKAWRDRIGRMLRLRSCWDARQPQGGTHAGGRLIDAIYTNAPTSAAHVSHVAKPASVDHRAIVCTLDLGDLP